MAFDRNKFYLSFKTKTKKPLQNSQVQGFDRILDLMIEKKLPLAHATYVLTTGYWESNKTMEGVREAYWVQNAEAWRKKNLRYWPWYGRGLVQLTWIGGYQRADKECAEAGLTKPGEIMAKPDLVMRPDIATFILVQGMIEGWFAPGQTLSKYLPMHGVATREQYMAARGIINGHDKADEIEDYAQIFERCLRDAGWAFM